MNMFTIKIVIALLTSVAFSGLLYSGYHYVKDIGYKEAEVKYTKAIKDRDELVSSKILAIEITSRDLVYLNKANSKKLTDSMSALISLFKGKTLTIYKDGKCIPTKDFSNSIQLINKTVNESIK